MPYNPGISDRSGELLASGIERGKQNALQVLMWALDRSSKTKELKTVAKTAFPERSEDIGKMNLEGVAGFLQGQKLLADQQQAALASQLRQAQLGQLQSEAAGRTAMGSALREAAPGPPTASPVSVLPPGTGMERIFGGTVQTQPQPNANALVAAIMRNPAAANTPTGQAVLGDWMRTQNLMQRGEPEFGIKHDIPMVFNRYTGQFEIDPRYTAAAKASARTPPPQPGTAPILSPDGRFYWDQRQWKPVPQRKRSLFDQDTDVTGATPGSSQPGGPASDPMGLFGN